MKAISTTFFIFFFTCAMGFAQKVIVNGKELAEIKPTGEISMAGKVVGLFEKNGDVYKMGELVGVIKPNSEFWINGTRAGKMELDCSVIRAGKVLGKVEPSGKIWENGLQIGEARGVKKEWTAAFYFFYFKEEIASLK